MTDLETFLVAVLAAAALFGLLREAWRAGWLPMQCACCHHLVQHRHSRRVPLTLGVWVQICDECFAEKYPGGFTL